MRHGPQLAGITLLWLVGLKIDWDCLVPHCIMGSHDQWEFQLLFRPQWQSLCTALTAGCLPLELCKGTVKESSCFSVKTPKQNGRLFADSTFKWILLIEMFSISIIISVKFLPKGLIEKKKSALIQIMAWHQTDNNPFCESMMAQVTYEVSWGSRRVFVWHCTLANAFDSWHF